MTRAVYSIEWAHPDLGEIREYACWRHRDLVGRGLSTLGVGSVTTRCPAGADCHRCGHHGEFVRSWLRTAVIEPRVTKRATPRVAQEVP